MSGTYSGAAGNLGLPPSQDADVVVATFDAQGLRTAYQIGGRGLQLSAGIAAAPDGAAWVFVENNVGTEASSELLVGSASFSNG